MMRTPDSYALWLVLIVVRFHSGRNKMYEVFMLVFIILFSPVVPM